MPDLGLAINGKTYSGWNLLTLSMSLETLAPAVSASAVEAWAADDRPPPIAGGDAVEVKYGGKRLFRGYVDEDGISYDATSRSIDIPAHGKTIDLVECSAIHQTGQWTNTPLLTIASNLCAPFDVKAKVANGVSTGAPFDTFKIQEGEKVYDCLERGCRMRGLLMQTNEDGDLVFTKTSAARLSRTVLELGKNVLRGTRRNTMSDRFSQYIVKGQVPGNNNFFGEQASALEARAYDNGVPRYRPLVLQAEAPDAKALTDRVLWERNVRLGRALRLTYTVAGWEQNNGELWRPNLLVRVRDRWANVDRKLLLVGVRLSKSNEEQVAELELTDKKALSVEPAQPERTLGTDFHLFEGGGE